MFDAINAMMTLSLLNLLMVAVAVSTILLTSKDISKVGAILLGMVLILAAGWAAFQIQMRWIPFAQSLINSKGAHGLSTVQATAISNAGTFFMWIIPFVTASWGTNIISDSVARNFSYSAKWSVPKHFGHVLLWVLRMIWATLSWIWGRFSDSSIEQRSERRTSMPRSSRRLLSLLAELPHFDASAEDERLVNMLDGSVINFVRVDEENFGRYLMITWPGAAGPVRVEGSRYLQMQIKTAERFGHDITGVHGRINKEVRDIRGW
ncbi:hypothetical protein ACFQ3P_38580 [Paraburkholderia sabiae]|uniref:Uncharacterized protein n=1 Tax=Paraburkholderia sabiae TaxID=273251 RepID=A0ABU9QPV9_9BURK|nr:hypothetical protein [Paraburkholderia sabiae]WJZ74382.1 hypothetical protein QEN71_00775 [Paraburkholderia sabiae]CAD6562656.1 hypothetical protein LMG24235_07895 [Paraburkholderia sabiae]